MDVFSLRWNISEEAEFELPTPIFLIDLAVKHI